MQALIRPTEITKVSLVVAIRGYWGRKDTMHSLITYASFVAIMLISQVHGLECMI